MIKFKIYFDCFIVIDNKYHLNKLQSQLQIISDMNSTEKSFKASDYGLNEKEIPFESLKAHYGEILTCSQQSKGGLQFIAELKGREILNISGGNRKVFLFEEFDDSQNIVTALHSQIQDNLSYEGQQVLPIDQIVTSLQGCKIAQIKSGKYHNIVLTADGAVYSYGKGDFGSLGLGGSLFQPTPRQLLKLQNRKIISIACGMFHTLALTNLGDLYSWGRGFQGQLGLHNQIQTASSPQFVTHFFKYDNSQNIKRLSKNRIYSIACGSYHSIAIDQKGSVYCWGEARVGQTGTGKKVKQPFPVKVPLMIEGQQKKAQKIAGGFGHTLCLSQGGQLFAWGLNIKGQLGLCDLPQQMVGQNKQIVGQSKQIVGQNKLKYTKAVFFPVHIRQSSSKQNLPPFVQISCGFCNSFAIDKHGRAWGWGGGNIGFKDKHLERGPVILTEGTETKKFSKVFANENYMILFAPLLPLYFKPCLTPSNGNTEITFFGNGFADCPNQSARFILPNSEIQISIKYDQQTSTYFCQTPDFTKQNVQYPCECEIQISLDKKKYFKYPKKLLIYDQKLSMQTFQPKCGSTFGNREIKIYMPLHPMIQRYCESYTVGFKSSSQDSSAENKIQDWICSEGHYFQDSITCKLPIIPLFNQEQPFYLLDISLNGQQFTEHPQTFRFYSITETSLTPAEGFDTGQFQVLITGKGLFDTPHKQLSLCLKFNWNEKMFDCKRSVDLKWNKNEKSFSFKMPSLKWIIGDHDLSPQFLEQAKKHLVILNLSVAKKQSVEVGKFKFINPPPPPEPEEDKDPKNAKKDAKKAAKK